jgi:hypothetical protein
LTNQHAGTDQHCRGDRQRHHAPDVPTSTPLGARCIPAAFIRRFRSLTSGGSNQRRKPMPISAVVVDVGEDVGVCHFELTG